MRDRPSLQWLPLVTLCLLACLPAAGRASWATNGDLLIDPSGLPASPTLVPSASGVVFLAWLDGRSGYNTDVRGCVWTDTGIPATGWTPGGSLVTAITCRKYELCATADGAGGALYAWSDNRCVGFRQIYAVRLGTAGPSSAGWTANGVHLAATSRDQVTPAIAADGAGGAFVAWQEVRGADADIFMQHLDATGAVVSGWPALGLGVAVVAGVQSTPVLSSDAAGGVFVAWQDRRGGHDAVYLQHMSGAGAIEPGWTANGVAICAASGDQRGVNMLADDAGGVLLAWQDSRAGAWDVYASRLQPNAARFPGWSATGVAVCTAAGDQTAVRAVGDGSHGVWLTWQDHRGLDSDIYAMRLAGDASTPAGWPANGLAIAASTGEQTVPDVASDGGSAFVAWAEGPAGAADIRATHVAADGSRIPGWPAAGALICDALGEQSAPHLATTGGAAYLLWSDTRDAAASPALYVQRLLSDGPIQVRPLALAASHHDGQIFLTWSPPPDTGWTHRVYVRAAPILTDADLVAAKFLGEVGDSSATDHRLSGILGVVCPFRTDSAAVPLPANKGLFVVTAPSSRQVWYAVTSHLRGGPDDRHVVPGGNALLSPVQELLDSPRPVFERQLRVGTTTSDVYTLWTSSQDTPLFPAMSNRLSWPYDCGVTHGAHQGPAFVLPHQREGNFTQQLLASGSIAEWVLGLDDYTLNTDVQTYWYGYAPGYDFLSSTNPYPATGEVVDYTNRRVLHTIRWWRRTFDFDTTSHYAFGYSLGGTYSMHLGLAHPELITAVMSSVGKVDFSFESDPDPLSAFNPGMPYRVSLCRMWGTTASNLPTSEGPPIYTVMNDDSPLARGEREGAAFLVNFSGRHDNTVGWAEKMRYFAAKEAHRQGGIELWDNRDHAAMAYPGAMGPMLDLRYLYRFSSDLSWPAFSRCSKNDDAGDGTAASGDSVGTINGYMDWVPDVVDSATRWEVTLTTRALTTRWGLLPAPESLTVDVTPRRVQRFRPPPGAPVDWTATRLADGAQVQGARSPWTQWAS